MIAEPVLAATIAASELAAPVEPAATPACDLDAMRNERAEILQPSIDRAARRRQAPSHARAAAPGRPWIVSPPHLLRRCAYAAGKRGVEKMAGAAGELHHVSVSRARLAVLERALVAGLRAGEPEAVRQISASFQDSLLNAAAAPHASMAYRAGFRRATPSPRRPDGRPTPKLYDYARTRGELRFVRQF